MCKLSSGRMQKHIKFDEIRDRVISKGYSAADLDACIDTYARDDVWVFSPDSNLLSFMSVDDDGAFADATEAFVGEEEEEEEEDEDL
jgi:hypothetical protein